MVEDEDSEEEVVVEEVDEDLATDRVLTVEDVLLVLDDETEVDLEVSEEVELEVDTEEAGGGFDTELVVVVEVVRAVDAVVEVEVAVVDEDDVVDLDEEQQQSSSLESVSLQESLQDSEPE